MYIYLRDPAMTNGAYELGISYPVDNLITDTITYKHLCKLSEEITPRIYDFLII